MKTVKILGAGPSGLSAAINLSRDGYNVDIFERNSMLEPVSKVIFKESRTGPKIKM